MTILPDGYLAPDIFDVPKLRRPRARGVGFAGVLIGLAIIVIAIVLLNVVRDEAPRVIPSLVLIVGLVLALSSSALLAWSRPALTSEPTDDPRVAHLTDWVSNRYGVAVSRRSALVLLGEIPEGNTISVDEHDVMLGTPAVLRPAERIGLIRVEDGIELPRAGGAGSL